MTDDQRTFDAYVDADVAPMDRVHRLRRDGCPHDDTVPLPVPSPRHLSDDHEWAGKHPIWCRDCRDIADRVTPEELARDHR